MSGWETSDERLARKDEKKKLEDYLERKANRDLQAAALDQTDRQAISDLRAQTQTPNLYMKIIAATIQLTEKSYPDKITLETDLPSPIPTISQAPLTFTFKVDTGTASEYLRNNFPGVPVSVIRDVPLDPDIMLSLTRKK